MNKSKQSKAGHKAWATRRKNEAFAKRSVAAKKAWVTRRKNAAGGEPRGVTTNCVACEVNDVENYEPPHPMWNSGCGGSGLTLSNLPLCAVCRQAVHLGN